MAQILTFPSAGKLQGLYQPAFAAALQAAEAATPPAAYHRPLLTAESMARSLGDGPWRVDTTGTTLPPDESSRVAINGNITSGTTGTLTFLGSPTRPANRSKGPSCSGWWS